ncbi:MAG: amidase family protein, partial [Pseudomonadota bacterium]
TYRYPPKRNGDRFTPQGSNNFWASLCGFPALSVPMGFTEAGLPLGLQLMGAPRREARVLQAGWLYEGLTRHRRPPPI